MRILAREFAMALDMWLVMHQDLRASRPIHAVFDALGKALTRYVRADRGRR